MNIEESIEILESYKESLEEYEDNPRIIQAIETLLTAYEKEKGENVKLRLQDIPLIEGELKAYKDRVNELKQELEKEKEKNKEQYKEFIKEHGEVCEKLKEDINKEWEAKIKEKIKWYEDFRGSILYEKYNYEEFVKDLQLLLKEE